MERQRKKKAFYNKLQKNRMNLGEGGNVIDLSSSDEDTGGAWNFEKELKRLDKKKKKNPHLGKGPGGPKKKVRFTDSPAIKLVKPIYICSTFKVSAIS